MHRSSKIYAIAEWHLPMAIIFRVYLLSRACNWMATEMPKVSNRVNFDHQQARAPYRVVILFLWPFWPNSVAVLVETILVEKSFMVVLGVVILECGHFDLDPKWLWSTVACNNPPGHTFESPKEARSDPTQRREKWLMITMLLFLSIFSLETQ